MMIYVLAADFMPCFVCRLWSDEVVGGRILTVICLIHLLDIDIQDYDQLTDFVVTVVLMFGLHNHNYFFVQPMPH